MQATLKRLSMLGAILALFGLLAIPGYAGAQEFDPLKKACDKGSAQTTALCEESGNEDDPIIGRDGVLTTATNILSAVTGIIAVIIIIVSGIRMITSRGDPSAINSARDTIIYAAIGIVIVVMARTIVVLVADRL